MTGKTIQTGIPLFGSTIVLPGAALCYAITFLMTDVIGEVWGRKEAQTIVYWGFAGQLLATLLIVFTQQLPAAESDDEIHRFCTIPTDSLLILLVRLLQMQVTLLT